MYITCNLSTITDPRVEHLPEGVFLISERLLGKHHDGAGVDRQGQPVVQVHVLQPVVIDLDENTGTPFERCGFVQLFGLQLLLSELRRMGNRVKSHYSVPLPGVNKSGREYV